MNKINCDDCDASKYGGYIKNQVEYCLKHNKELKPRDDDTTEPCIECNGKDFKEDTWAN